MFKIILNICFVIFLAWSGYFIYDNYIIKCHYPLSYSVGNFDGRFGISRQNFVKIIGESEKVWEDSAGTNLFNYQEGAEFKINLVYDERQEVTYLAKESEELLEGDKAAYNLLLSQYNSAKTQYDQKIRSYDHALSDYESRLNNYNQKVDFYNKKGGAPPKEFNELQKEGEVLSDLARKLDQERTAINSLAQNINELGGKINSMAQEFNLDVDIHNERFGQAREFDQGDYQGDLINIYQFDTMSDLRLVVAHELGHSLGIEHVENPKSIMYYLMEKQDINKPALSVEDLTALKEVCKI